MTFTPRQGCGGSGWNTRARPSRGKQYGHLFEVQRPVQKQSRSACLSESPTLRLSKSISQSPSNRSSRTPTVTFRYPLPSTHTTGFAGLKSSLKVRVAGKAWEVTATSSVSAATINNFNLPSIAVISFDRREHYDTPDPASTLMISHIYKGVLRMSFLIKVILISEEFTTPIRMRMDKNGRYDKSCG
ncbi:hypothetical protein E2C01_000112 [Portunus trituberculatus]|uniref:Uncharacterized protein n=1 Tax=Portunus trituberculatus TaxID=210409 RepID=A0A5B7CDG0_PORTR|nr:hypothetical protein [Portunus trituberculatus]